MTKFTASFGDSIPITCLKSGKQQRAVETSQAPLYFHSRQREFLILNSDERLLICEQEGASKRIPSKTAVAGYNSNFGSIQLVVTSLVKLIKNLN